MPDKVAWTSYHRVKGVLQSPGKIGDPATWDSVIVEIQRHCKRIAPVGYSQYDIVLLELVSVVFNSKLPRTTYLCGIARPDPL